MVQDTSIPSIKASNRRSGGCRNSNRLLTESAKSPDFQNATQGELGGIESERALAFQSPECGGLVHYTVYFIASSFQRSSFIDSDHLRRSSFYRLSYIFHSFFTLPMTVRLLRSAICGLRAGEVRFSASFITIESS